MTQAPSHNLRLFVAIELPDDVRDALARAIDGLKRAGAADGLRWVRPEGMHLTLKFLGATPEDAVPAINTALRVAARGTPPLRLQPDGFGAFGGRRGLRVVWAGLTGDVDTLKALAANIDAALERLRIPREERALNRTSRSPARAKAPPPTSAPASTTSSPRSIRPRFPPLRSLR
jgi:2'-5' RNA ligase